MSADEFDVIRSLFAPLATSEGARGLMDDVAVLSVHGELVVTTDAIVEGVHFLPDDPIDTVAKKALRVNLSDLSAKGAKCVGVLLTLVWPAGRPSAQLAEFARGLAEDLKFYDVPLLGGDTTSTPGPLTISITALGEPLGERVPSRSDARIGEDIWVSGTIGDAWVGLEALVAKSVGRGGDELCDAFAHAITRYRVPQPRVTLAFVIAAEASASMDVSDGLIQDAGKLATASKVRMRIKAHEVPLSSETRDFLLRSGGALTLADALAGGDDYEVLFTAPRSSRERLALPEGRFTRIGVVEAGEGLILVDQTGAELKPGAGGYAHKLGS